MIVAVKPRVRCCPVDPRICWLTPLRTSAVTTAGRVMLFFVRVNQVLVRLWTRAMFLRVRACGGVPLSCRLSDRHSFFGMGSSGGRARVQRRFEGIFIRDERMENLLCAKFKWIHGPSRLWMVSVHGGCLVQSGRQTEHDKGIRWMPWHQEAMKDVARCEKPWGAASRL
jgi:hypothetical protein